MLLMMLIMMIITMKMMLLMMIMVDQNVSSPECHFKTINRIAPKKNKLINSFLSSRDRARQKHCLAESLGSPLVRQGH